MSHVCGNSIGREFLSNTTIVSLVSITPVEKDLYVLKTKTIGNINSPPPQKKKSFENESRLHKRAAKF